MPVLDRQLEMHLWTEHVFTNAGRRKCCRKDELKGKAALVAGRGGPWGCETSRLSHCINCRLTDGGKIVGPTHRQPYSPGNIPGTRLETQCVARRVRPIEESSDNGN
jgi:hypothetical protein